MATTSAEVYRHAVEFAHTSLDLTSNKQLLAKALESFNTAGFEEKWWDFWRATLDQHLVKFGEWKSKEENLTAAPAKTDATKSALPTAEVKG